VGNGLWREFYLKNQRECDRWLKGNAVIGSILAIAILAMAWAERCRPIRQFRRRPPRLRRRAQGASHQPPSSMRVSHTDPPLPPHLQMGFGRSAACAFRLY
jgi:hypothetical protein